MSYHATGQAREEGLSQWEEVLKGRAQDNRDATEKMEERQKALAEREEELRDFEDGRKARAVELAALEKRLSNERVKLERREVSSVCAELATVGV